MDTALEFMKLEKIELGGVQGKSLSAQVVSVHEEFQEQYKVFAEGTYDCLDPAQPVWPSEWYFHAPYLLNPSAFLYAILSPAFL